MPFWPGVLGSRIAGLIRVLLVEVSTPVSQYMPAEMSTPWYIEVAIYEYARPTSTSSLVYQKFE